MQLALLRRLSEQILSDSTKQLFPACFMHNAGEPPATVQETGGKRGVVLVTRIKFSFNGKPQATVSMNADACGLPLND